MSAKRVLIAVSETHRYVFAVYSDNGFAVYQNFPRTPHYQQKIRKIAREHGAEIAARIDWDSLPMGNFIDKFDGEQEARVRA